MKEINFMKRSGFNKYIDDMKQMNMIDKPISEKKLKQRTLRKTTTKHLMALVKQETPSPTKEFE